MSDLAIRGGAIQTIIDVIRSTNDPSTRKNSAIVLARMAKSPELMVVIREKRGMEILMSLGRQIVDWDLKYVFDTYQTTIGTIKRKQYTKRLVCT